MAAVLSALSPCSSFAGIAVGAERGMGRYKAHEVSAQKDIMARLLHNIICQSESQPAQVHRVGKQAPSLAELRSQSISYCPNPKASECL